MAKSKEFHEKREALIENKYNVDEIQQRILNGDGGSWIKEPYDPEAIFRLDRYHIYQEILRKIQDKKAQQDIRELFDKEKIDEEIRINEIITENIVENNIENEEVIIVNKIINENLENIIENNIN